MKTEFFGILTKVFYSGNAKRPGGEYTLTFLDISTKEEIVVYVKVRAKIEFDMNNQYVYRVVHIEGVLSQLYIVSNSLQDYLNQKFVSKQYNMINGSSQKMMFFLHWIFVIIIFAIISYLLLELFNK